MFRTLVETQLFASFQGSYQSVFHLRIHYEIFIGTQSRDDGVSGILTPIVCKHVDKIDDSSNASSSHGMWHVWAEKDVSLTMVVTMGFTGSTQQIIVKLTMAEKCDFAGRQERDVVSIHVLQIFRLPNIQVRGEGS